MSPRNFWHLSFCLILFNTKNILCTRQSSLAFVIDDTFSMQYEIDEVTKAVDSIIDIMDKTNTSEIADVVLVTFNDPGYELRLKSNSRTDIKRVLGSIKADGGIDCPEMALSGTKLGLEKSLVGSYMYVFTDEYPKDMYLENEVIKICQEKQIQVVFVVSPSSVVACQRQRKRDFTPYYNIAKACSGQVFRLSYKLEVPKVLPYVKEIAKGPRTVSSEKTIPANTLSTVDFTIDDETEYAIISTSGQNVSLRLQSGPTNIYEEIVWINNLKIIKINKAGYYVAEVMGKSATSIVIFGRTDFTFQHGFSDNVPSTYNGDVKQSNEETETNLLILVDDPNQAVQIQSVQILDMSEHILQKLPLNHISGNYYTTNKFVPPSTTYKITVIGEAIATGKILRRTSKTPIKPNPRPQSPAITIGDGSKTISVLYNSTLSLSCNVTAYPKPHITWRNRRLEEVVPQTTESASLTQYINNISVLNIKKGQKYYCAAENNMGSITAHVQVKVLEPFIVHEKPEANINAAYGKQITVHCNITSHLPMRIQWFIIKSGKDETVIHNSDKYFMSSRNTVLQIKEMEFNLEGNYKCVASLVWEESKQIMFSTRVTIYDLEAPEFNEQDDINTVREHTGVNLKCNPLKGNPAPKITWMFEDHLIASDTELHITDVTIADSGIYTCIAENVKGRAEHIVKLNVEVVPEIDKQIVIMTVREKQSVTLTCNVKKGNPKPSIIWKHIDNIIGSSALLHLDDITMDNAGNYKCVAKNPVGSDEHVIKLDVEVAPEIDKHDVVIIVEENDSVSLPCNVVKGNPIPKITWLYKNQIIGTTTPLKLEVITIADDGDYKCVIENPVGRDEHIIKIDVRVAPKIDKNDTFKTVRENASVSLQCNVINGNPIARVTWEYKKHVIGSDALLNLTHVSMDNAGDYKCIAKNDLGSDVYVIKLDVEVPPEIEKSNVNLKVEEKKSITLQCHILKGNPQPHITWEYKNNTISSEAQLELTNISLSNEGDYKCIAQNSIGHDEYIVKLQIEEIPEIEKSTTKVTIREKNGVSLHCNVIRGNPRPKITWKYKNQIVGTDAQLNLTDVGLANAGEYICIAENKVGRDEYIVKLDVDVVPVIDKHITNAKVRENNTANLQCIVVKGNPMPSITWTFKNQSIGTDAQLNLSDVSLANAGEYKCIVENNVGRDEYIVKLDVDVFPVIDKRITNTTVREKNNANLQCIVIKGNPKPRITWKFKNQIIGTDAQLNLTDVSLENAGEYICVVENNVGRDEYIVKVDVDVFPVIDKHITNTKVREKNNVNLQCIILKGAPKPRITWKFKNQIVGTDAQLNLTDVSLANAGEYICIVQNNVGRDEYIVKLDVDVVPVVDKQNANLKVRENNGIRLECNVLKGNPKPRITWKFNNQIVGTNAQLNLTDVSLANAGDYKCIVENSVGRDEYTAKLDVGVVPEIDKNDSNINVRDKESITLQCNILKGNPQPEIIWEYNNNVIESDTQLILTKVSLANAGHYKCIAKNSEGQDEHIINLDVEVIPEIDKHPSVVTVREKQSVSLQCNVTKGNPKPNIYWKYNNHVIGSDTPLELKDITLGSAGDYECVAQNIVGQDVLIIKLEIETGPDINKSNVTVTVKENDSVDIECKLVKGNPKPTLTWKFNNSLISSNSVLHLEQVSVADSGDYKCVAENAIDSDEHIFKLDVLASPKIYKDNTIKKVIEYNTVVMQCPILKGNPKPKVTWKYTGKLVSTDKELRISNVTFDKFGDYTCRAENSEGYDEHTYKVIVEVIPEIDKHTTVINVTEKNPVYLYCRIRKGYPNPIITWMNQNGVIVPGEVLSFTNVSVSDSGSYKCIARNALGSDEHIIKLDVTGAPKIIESITDHNSVVGDIALSIPCEVIGNPKPSITWTKDGETIDEKDESYLIQNGTLIIKKITKESHNSYTCKAKNEFGQDEKNHVVDIASTVDDNKSKRVHYVLKDTNEQLNCSASSSETDHVRWFRNGYYIQDGPYLYIKSATMSHNGNYTCRVSNSRKSKNGETLEVMVDTPPTLKRDADNQLIINWKGGKDSISCRVNTYGGTEKVTWYHNGKEMLKENNMHLYFPIWGNYTCRVSNYFGEVEDHFLIKSEDCLLNMAPSYAANLPLVLTKTLELPRFITKDHHMIIPSGTPLKLSCNRFQKFSNTKEISVICSKEDQFLRTEDNGHLKFSDLYCSIEIKPKLKRTGIHCAGENTEIVKIGFQSQNFTTVYETCYNTVEKLPLYTKIYIPNPKFQMYKDDDFTEKRYVYGQFGSGSIKTGYKKTIKQTRCSYVKGQLVNAEDIIYGVAQTSALLSHEFNDVTYFSCVNKPSWKDLSDSIRRYMIGSRDDPGHMIWSGTSHWQMKSGIPFARYLWKVVKAFGSEETLAIVFINDPFPRASDVLCGDEEKCQDLSFEISDWQTYCCDLFDFAEAFDIPMNVFT